MEGQLFADVVLPLALPRLLTYSVPVELADEVAVGARIGVQLGKKKIYSAIIQRLHSNKPEGYDTKDILMVLDKFPIILPQQMELWTWISTYYMCTLGEVMKAALPAGLKLESETKITLTSNEELEVETLGEMEKSVLGFVSARKSTTLADLSEILPASRILPTIRTLLDDKLVVLDEVLSGGFKPKREYYVRLHPSIISEDDVNTAFMKLDRAAVQQKAFLAYISMASPIDFAKPKEVERKLIIDKAEVSAQAIKGLKEKCILDVYEREVTRLGFDDDPSKAINPLSEGQQAAMDTIISEFETKDVVLLHGVTGSGKTEVYIHLINKMIAEGKQVLYLLPEIALTAQIINRLKRVFGSKIGIFHSKFSNEHRVETYLNLLDDTNENQYQIILGVRSSIFLPFKNLGLIIVDEEHENTYKQYDPAPRYNARDVAVVMAAHHGAKVLMGTATPAIETYFNAKTGKYGLVELASRYNDAAMPEISIVDVRRARKQKQLHSHFTSNLLDAVGAALKRSEQVILFQNRRGFAPFLECEECGWVPQCEHCNVSLTYHKRSNQLVCHYCGYSMSMPTTCLACGSPSMTTKGFGTEKIEEELQIFFPEASIERLDLDTARSRSSYERIIGDFEERRIDILVGTQMVTKGLDFDNVSLVGVLDADTMLRFPDFRAYERSYQLISQVSGRAGRKDKKGSVIVQTSQPDSDVLRMVQQNDYHSLYEWQLVERHQFLYPPFYRLTKITLKHVDRKLLQEIAEVLGYRLRAIFGDRILGPEEPAINRIQNRYLMGFVLKMERTKPVTKVKELLWDSIYEVQGQPKYRGMMVSVDVDPM
ncbi:primosomal protein N' [uncultured Acetobacteroides sp.]|uniref:replication restart helicase PriA n=1 Tax=uncultured Acetobacteroides sp. TaxID=1760811 RepID=UPI0029F49FDE|nr:primosomal protein N' [uncultured Acetobacteroides sp.]